MIVKIGSVVTCHTPSTYHVRKMMDVLRRQGQIEPLQVREHGVNYKTFEENVHADEIVNAATLLGWDTLLVHVTEKYEP